MFQISSGNDLKEEFNDVRNYASVKNFRFNEMKALTENKVLRWEIGEKNIYNAKYDQISKRINISKVISNNENISGKTTIRSKQGPVLIISIHPDGKNFEKAWNSLHNLLFTKYKITSCTIMHPTIATVTKKKNIRHNKIGKEIIIPLYDNPIKGIDKVNNNIDLETFICDINKHLVKLKIKSAPLPLFLTKGQKKSTIKNQLDEIFNEQTMFRAPFQRTLLKRSKKSSLYNEAWELSPHLSYFDTLNPNRKFYSFERNDLNKHDKLIKRLAAIKKKLTKTLKPSERPKRQQQFKVIKSKPTIIGYDQMVLKKRLKIQERQKELQRKKEKEQREIAKWLKYFREQKRKGFKKYDPTKKNDKKGKSGNLDTTISRIKYYKRKEPKRKQEQSKQKKISIEQLLQSLKL